MEAVRARMQAEVERRFPQFVEFVEAQNQLIASGACLLTGGTYAEDYRQYCQLVAHVEALWDSSCILFRAESYPQALFLAVTCLEETGKLGVTRFQLVLREAAREHAEPGGPIPNVRRRGNPFYSHSKKHLLAAGAGAIINRRLERVVGRERVLAFLDNVKADALERLRESALYADLGASGPVLPSDQVRREEACFYVVLAGELMAEILGFEPLEWQRLLERVQAFEREVGHQWE